MMMFVTEGQWWLQEAVLLKKLIISARLAFQMGNFGMAAEFGKFSTHKIKKI